MCHYHGVAACRAHSDGGCGGTGAPCIGGTCNGSVQRDHITLAKNHIVAEIDRRRGIVVHRDRIGTGAAVAIGTRNGIDSGGSGGEGGVRATVLPRVGGTGECCIQGDRCAGAERYIGTEVHCGSGQRVDGDSVRAATAVGGDRNTVIAGANVDRRCARTRVPRVGRANNGSIEQGGSAWAKGAVRTKVERWQRGYRYIHFIAHHTAVQGHIQPIRSRSGNTNGVGGCSCAP